MQKCRQCSGGLVLVCFFLNQPILALHNTAVTKVSEHCPLFSMFLALGYSVPAGFSFFCSYKSLSLHLWRAADVHLPTA